MFFLLPLKEGYFLSSPVEWSCPKEDDKRRKAYVSLQVLVNLVPVISRTEVQLFCCEAYY